MLRITISILLPVLLVAVAQAGEPSRTVAVDGRGFAAVRPDMARLTLAVEERDASLSVAQEHVAGVAAAVLRLLGDLGIDERRINSTGATVQPDYRWNHQTEKQELLGYIVQRRFDVELRKLDVLGALIDGAVRAGVNRVSPPVLDSTRRRDARREALAAAAEDARRNAEALAGTLGVRLGPVMQINAGSPKPMPQPVARAGMAQLGLAEAGAATYNPGDMRVEARVGAVFALLDDQ
ncbi:MAG: SIMPL domain-containing protein [Gammaproteobacteria bacterium]